MNRMIEIRLALTDKKMIMRMMERRLALMDGKMIMRIMESPKPFEEASRTKGW